MFRVNIESENETKTYTVYDKGELYQHFISTSFQTGIDTEKLEIDQIKVVENGVVFILKNTTPVIISDGDFEEYLKTTTGIFQSFQLMPTTPITKENYNMLYRLYKTQYQETEEYKDELEIQNDIDKVRKQLTKTKGRYITF